MQIEAQARRDGMILTIWRHGQAGSAPSDRIRELTPVGAGDLGFGCQQFLRFCEARSIALPTVILHSPWLRTTQSAEILAGAFSHATLTPDAVLGPDSSITEINQAIASYASDTVEHLLLVSHQPLVSQLIDYYLGTPGLVPGLSPGGMATLELIEPAAGCASLSFWALPPEYEASI
jgi:phosphohistidine phosphatase